MGNVPSSCSKQLLFPRLIVQHPQLLGNHFCSHWWWPQVDRCKASRLQTRALRLGLIANSCVTEFLFQGSGWTECKSLLCFLFSENVCFRQFIHRIITNWLHVIANLTPFRLAVNWGQFPTWMASFNCKLITDWHRLIAFLSASRCMDLMTTTDFDDCQRCSVPLTLSKGMTLHQGFVVAWLHH